MPLREASISAELERVLGWADEIRRPRVRANADTPGDAARARSDPRVRSWGRYTHPRTDSRIRYSTSCCLPPGISRRQAT